MKKAIFSTMLAIAAMGAVGQVGRSAMSEAYWEIWNEMEQAKIDADIEANRKADATVD